MKLMLASKFSKAYFVPGSEPDARTLQADVKAGRLPGKIIGKRIYVDVDQLDTMPTVQALPKQRPGARRV